MNLLKILLLIPLIAIAMLVVMPKTYAASGVFSACNNPSLTSIHSSVLCNDVGKGNKNPSSDPVIAIIKTAIDILSIIIGIASVVTILVSGFRLIMSEGSSENISGARSALIFAVVGIVIAVFAQIIVAFVLDKIK